MIRKVLPLLFIGLLLISQFSLFAQQNVGIGTTTPNNSAILDLTATNKGLLVPRMTTAQRIAIVAPATGLLVYDTNFNQFWYFDGTIWVQAIGPMGPTGPTGVAGAQGPTGTNGAQGPTGQQGIQGVTGPSGIAGAQGATGPTGQAGVQGPTGPSGTAGIQGATGPSGIDGLNGSTGIAGPTGPTGTAGVAGVTGPTGPSGTANAWNLTGNSGTVDGTNFLGTIDNIPFSIRVNNQRSGRIDQILGNTFFGYKSGLATTVASLSTFVGFEAGLVANGVGAGGGNNVFIGYQAGRANTSGYNNVFNGYLAGLANISGVSNTFVGFAAGSTVTGGMGNSLFGSSNNGGGGGDIVSGNYNSRFGYGTNWSSGDVTGSSYFGYNAGAFVTTGNNNTCLGRDTGPTGSAGGSGTNNTFIGYGANCATNILSNATALGYNASVTSSNAIILGGTGASAVNVGIGITAPNSSAKLDITSTNTGILIPRVALTQTSSNAPVGAGVTTSLMVYNTATINDVTPGFYYWSGASWTRFATGTGGSGWLILGNAGTNAATNFVGTTDAVDFVVRANNIERGRFTSPGFINFSPSSLPLWGTPPQLRIKTDPANSYALQLFLDDPNTANARITFGTGAGTATIETIGNIALNTDVSGNSFTTGYQLRTVNAASALQNRITVSSGVNMAIIAMLNSNVGISTSTPNTKLDVNGDIALRCAALPLVNGANNDVNLLTTEMSYYRITGPGAAASITGMTGGYDGRIVVLFNGSGQYITLAHQNAGSSATNRLLLKGASDFVIAPNDVITFIYNATDSRWIELSTSNETQTEYKNTFSVTNTSGLAGFSSGTYTVVPGLTQTITLTRKAKVLIWTSGVVRTTAAVNGGSGVKVCVFRDGVAQTATSQCVDAICNATFFNVSKNWSISHMETLNPGTYTYDVRAYLYIGSNANICNWPAGGGSDADYGKLTITVIEE
jgi:hypothetical protein